MIFSSLEFIFRFLPVYLAVYYIVPAGWRNAVLLAGSLCFYIYGTLGHPLYIILLLLSAAAAFACGRAIGESRSARGRKAALAAGLCCSLGMLAVFKYLGHLPLGISFYTFQICSYLADVYRGTIPAERSAFRLAGYVCMFPQLLSGPLIRYRQVSGEWNCRTHSAENLECGFRLFAAGLGMKVLIANQAGSLWQQTFTIGFESISTPMAWLGLLAYTLQIYFDFYGYSLMASGLGRMMGFHFPDNFSRPYLSVSMTEFWRRWHMTLGGWFRDYVYIPLGGSRAGKRKTLRNLLAVWLLTALWHGAGWNFMLWGALMFLLVAAEKSGLIRILEGHRLLGHLYMAFWIPVGWLLFALEDLSMLKIYLTRLFPLLGDASGAVFAQDYLKYGRTYAFSLLLGLLCIGSLPERCCFARRHRILTAAVLLAFFWGSVYCIWKGMDDPFLYFNF